MLLTARWSTERRIMDITKVMQEYYASNAYYSCRTEKEDSDFSFSLEEDLEKSETSPEAPVSTMTEGKRMTSQELRDSLRQKIDEMYQELKKGRKEPSYQIGAASYTIKEWKDMLKNFDEVQEEIREAIREEIAKRAEHADQSHYLVKEKSREEKEADVLAAVSGTADPQKTEEKARRSEPTTDEEFAAMITAEYTMARFPMAEEGEGLYITVYTKDAIYCRRAGESEPIWEIPLEEGQYEKIMEFLHSDKFAENENFTFAASQSFWEDFLSGKLDIDAFMDFWNYRVENGIADFTDETEDGVYINREAAIYGIYTNRPDLFHIINPEELLPKGEGTVFPEGWEKDWENQWPKKVVMPTGEEKYVWSWKEFNHL